MNSQPQNSGPSPYFFKNSIKSSYCSYVLELYNTAMSFLELFRNLRSWVEGQHISSRKPTVLHLLESHSFINSHLHSSNLSPENPDEAFLDFHISQSPNRQHPQISELQLFLTLNSAHERTTLFPQDFHQSHRPKRKQLNANVCTMLDSKYHGFFM